LIEFFRNHTEPWEEYGDYITHSYGSGLLKSFMDGQYSTKYLEKLDVDVVYNEFVNYILHDTP
jgi:hypothetical protein